MAANNLKQKAASGMVWTSIQKFAKMGISFISGIILARLLTPQDYGCIGMLSIFMLVAETFVDGGFGSALIQKRRPTQVDYSTIFFFNLLMSFAMYFLLFLSAPLISNFYKMPILCPVLRVQGLVVIFHAFSIIQRNQLRKQFRFKKLTIVTLTTSIISLAVTILMAYRGYGVWSLVAMNLLLAFIPAVIFWLTNKWYPSLVFSIKSFKELFGFGFFMFLSNSINTICNNIQGLLIGRFYNPATLGYYTKAQSTENLASTSISNIMGQVTYPLYSEYQYNKTKLGTVIKRFTCTIAYFSFPLMLLLILLAKPIFILLYSDRWIPSIPYFQILCLSGIAACLQGVNFQAIAAVGLSKIMFNWTLVKRSVSLIFIVLGLLIWGMKGLLLGMVLQSWFVYLVNAYLVHKYIGYKLSNQLLDLLPIMLLSIISFCVAYSLVLLTFDLNFYLISFIQLFTYILCYISFSILFKMDSYEYVKESMPIFLSRFKHQN